MSVRFSPNAVGLGLIFLMTLGLLVWSSPIKLAQPATAHELTPAQEALSLVDNRPVNPRVAAVARRLKN
jgi:hypothetical protein